VHYTSEHSPVFFLFVGLYFTAQVALARGLSWTRVVVFAVLGALSFSIVPFAKLQGTYLAMFSGLLLVAAVFLRPVIGLRQRLIACGITVAAALLFPACLVAVVAMGGALDYFIQSYFGNALAYQVAGIPGVSSWQMLGLLLGKSQDAAIYAAGLCVFVLVATTSLLAPSPVALSKRIVVFLAVTFLLTVLAFSAVLATQRDYGHYLIFLPFFSALFVSGLAGALVDRGRSVRTTPRAVANYELTCVGLLILTSIFPVVGFRLENPHPWVGSARSWSEKSAAPHTGPGNAIRNIGKDSNRRLAVWGYVPELYIESGMIQATRLSTSSAIFNDNHLRAFFLTTYFEDLERAAPDLFVDAVAEGQFMMNDPAIHAHETVPEIEDYVRRNYELVREVRGVRIFRRLPSPREPSATSNEP
jgi:hypothetical protein